MLEIRNIGKTYRGGVRALDGVDLSIPAGMYGLLGRNGAGKSTLMRTMAAIQLPDHGSVMFDGIDALADPVALRRKLGYLPQAFGAYPHASCRTMLRHLAVLKGLPDDDATARQIDFLLDCTNLTAHAGRAVTTYSGGMRQRFGIAQALLGDPALLILDEPTAGLDPEERIRLYNLLSLISGDRVVVLSTHIVDDIEQLCSKAAIIHAGRVVAQGNVASLVQGLDGQIWQSPVAAPTGSSALQLSMAYRRGVPVFRYLSRSSPGDGFTAVPPTLEDRYFLETQDHQPC